jgi:hypothetical protein
MVLAGRLQDFPKPLRQREAANQRRQREGLTLMAVSSKRRTKKPGEALPSFFHSFTVAVWRAAPGVFGQSARAIAPRRL